MDKSGFLEIRNLSVSYGGPPVLHDFHLVLPEGKIVGLLGPNGAGKTTLVKTIIGMKRPTAGDIFLGADKFRPGDVGFQRLLGVVPQELAICPELTALENLRFFGRLYGLAGNELESRCRLLLEQVGLLDRAGQVSAQFSGGMQRRLNLAVAAIHQPRLMILDEPTVGVDPQSRYQMLELVKVWNREGMTILYTSHFLDEAERLCDELVIMDHGKLLARGSLHELLAGLPTRVSFQWRTGLDRAGWGPFDGIPEMAAMRPDGKGRVQCEFPPDSPSLATLLGVLGTQGEAWSGFEAEKPRLETLFLKLTGRQFRDE